MRLAVFTNQFPSTVSTFFARDMRGLLEAGVEVDVFPFYPLEPALWQYVPDILDQSVLPRTKVHHCTLGESLWFARPWPVKKLRTFLQDAATISASAAKFGIGSLAKNAYVFQKAWVWSQQYSGDYDHVLAYWGNYSATCAMLFHRLLDRRVPFSMFLHAGIDLYEEQAYLRQKLLYADNIIVVCDFNRRFIHERYRDIAHLISDKIHTHHLGLDFSEFTYQLDGRPPRKIIAVGRPDRQKGFDYLLRATQELASRGITIEVEFVGHGKDADYLRTLAAELQIQDRVTFRGWLPFGEVRTAMRSATILVHPSSEIWDAVPTVIKEAMALGTPVIAANVAGIPELLDDGNCGVLVPPKDATALANAIEMLVTHNELRWTYAAAARRYAEKTFDLWRNGSRLAEILRSTTKEIGRSVRTR
jgi:colanic acid/amylovoran biosynthesis glycosyltransferase